MLGTASTVQRWILVEQPGPWGHDALLESHLPVEVGRHLKAAARRLGARPVLIRRPGVHAPAQPRTHQLFLVATAPEARLVRRVTFAAPEDLVGLLDAAVAHGMTSVGEDGPDRLVLVCTHGRHDACCAVEGRPVAAEMATAIPDVWESSHVGGDRFAANVVVLPEGTYHGRVRAGDVAAFARDLAAGQVDLDHFRGNSRYPFAVQAAEIMLRRQLALRDLDAVWVLGHDTGRDGQVLVRLEAGGHAWDVVVAVDADPEAHLLTCQAGRPRHAPRYTLVAAAPRRE